MGLFSKKPQLKTYLFHQAKGFRGFHRYPIVTFGNDTAMKNCDTLANKDLSDCNIIFKEAKYAQGTYLQVFIDNLQIGSIFKEDQINDMQNGKILDIHVRFEQENVNFEMRNVARVFAKYED